MQPRALPSSNAALAAHRNPTEQRMILEDGRTLGFAEYGDPNGKPVLEFHGWPSCRLEAWIYDEPAKKLGARVIGIDRPGFGISTYTKGYRIVDWPRDVLEFADKLGLGRFAVAGISSGSPYALACARFIPERLKGCAVVGGLSPLKVEGERLWPHRYVEPNEIHIARMANTVPCVARSALWYISNQVRRSPEQAMQLFMKGAPPSDRELLNDERGGRHFPRAVAECSRGGPNGPIDSIGLEVGDWGFRLQDISMHVSLWQGELDNLVFPAAADYMASRLPNRTLHKIPGAGHLTVIARHAEDVLRELLAAS
jgi:pimeloyl-ACP methyl ester carboxylesterase